MSTATETTTLEHPTLGKLTGLAHPNGVSQFLGLQYATLRSRFAAPELATRVSPDCTKWGPTPPQPAGGIAGECFIIGAALPGTDAAAREAQSETDCLTLHIHTPTTAPAAPLPVLVFIHGGNNAIGSANWPHHDMLHFARPVVGVSINYRTNFPGFLYLPGAAAPANRGLADQHTALRWLHAHVAGFGGDPARITVAGESAGSVSVELLLRRADAPQLCSRAIMMSGTTKLLPPMPAAFHESATATAKRLLGEDLATVPINKFYEPPMPHALQWPFFPLASPELAHPITVPALSGFTAHDGGILKLSPLFAQPDPFCAHLAAEGLSAVLDVYGLPAAGGDAVEHLLTDIAFALPAQALGAAHYEFNAANPWDGMWKGKASHVLDVAYLFGTYDAQLGEAQRRVAEEYRSMVLSWVYGEDVAAEGEVRRIGGDGREGRERRGRLVKALENVEGGEERLRGVVMGFVARRPEL
ncbi:Alpha/Beta hydrolase protein [Geopyxis carbonaria]|nr:Alpha/Beta hydrolase protein [Geopyxis carbonaria]